MRAKDGSYYWLECRYTPIRDAAGRLLEIEGLLADITERKEAADKISVLAMTDALTGLANRQVFIDRLRQAFAATQRGAPPFAILYLDLDGFKDINDTLGHPAGDLLLKSVGERLKNCVRETDLVARLGGDEFAVLQTNRGDVASAGVLASKIHDALSAPYMLGYTEMRVTASIGISPYMSETAGPDEMLAQADIALYRAKDEGRNQYCFHTADLDREAHERVALANDLRQALEHDELELYFQPQVELTTGLIVGVEALIRWKSSYAWSAAAVRFSADHRVNADCLNRRAVGARPRVRPDERLAAGWNRSADPRRQSLAQAASNRRGARRSNHPDSDEMGAFAQEFGARCDGIHACSCHIA